MARPVFFRSVALLIACGFSLGGSYLYLRFTGEGGLTALDLERC